LYFVGGLCLALITIGYSSGAAFDRRFFALDFIFYAGLPAGAALALIKGRSAFHDLLRISYAAVIVTFLASLILLRFGYIDSKGSEGRELDGAMFTASFFIQMAFPVIWSGSRLSGKLQKCITWSGPALCVYFAQISATRSVLIVTIVSLVCTAIIDATRDRSKILWLGGGLLLAATVVVSGGNLPGVEEFQGTLLGERLAKTDITREDRFEELTAMLEQMGVQEWIHGTGFGSGFVSPIAVEADNGLAMAPHIGVLTLLYKGGIPAFLALILVPGLYAICGMLRPGSSGNGPYLAGAVIYLISSSLSGGWGVFPNYLLGAFLTLGLARRSERSSPVVSGAARLHASGSVPETGAFVPNAFRVGDLHDAGS
jgi:hypothetical protein